MNVFSIKLGLADQSTIIDKIKNAGGDVIQVSDGLIAKSPSSLSELKKEFPEATVAELDLTSADLSKDAKVFAGVG